MLRQLIPFAVRRRLKIWHRRLCDRQNGISSKLVFLKKNQSPADFPEQIAVGQPFLPGHFVENKISNIRLAASKITQITVEPGQIFSFWHLVGEPSAQRGYRDGRTLKNGRVEADPGGGLCQLSGILYFLALRGGLEILERHAHSVDLYAENSRFAPLGSDATVFFGYKDLRFLNSTDAPIAFRFEILDEEMTAFLCSPATFERLAIRFEAAEKEGKRFVSTFATGPGGTEKRVAESVYQLPVEG